MEELENKTSFHKSKAKQILEEFADKMNFLITNPKKKKITEYPHEL